MPKNLGNYSRLAWATAWRLGGRVKERTGLLTKTTLEHKPRRFPLHRPSKIIGTLMQGKPWVDKVAARGPHCAWLCYPCLKTWGNHCWLAWTGPWRSSGRCRGEGLCWKGKNQHRRATYNDHLDTRQDGFARQGWSPDRVQRRGEGPVKGVDDGVRRLATTKMHPPLPTQPHLCSQHCHRSNDMPTSFATKPVQRKWLGSTTTAAARGGRGLHGPIGICFP